jgi:hypothetical protein
MQRRAREAAEWFSKNVSRRLASPAYTFSTNGCRIIIGPSVASADAILPFAYLAFAKTTENLCGNSCHGNFPQGVTWASNPAPKA